MQSVERLTLIELFSTFFDRMSTSHPQRDTMIRELFQFKSLLYNNDGSQIENYLDNINRPKVAEKSPLRDPRGLTRVDNKENRENSSQRVSGTSRINRSTAQQSAYNQVNSKRTTTVTSCGHELDREALQTHANLRYKETGIVDCPICQAQLPVQDYSSLLQLTPFDEFKSKQSQLLRIVQSVLKNDDQVASLLNSLEQEETQSVPKQRQGSNGTEAFRNIQAKEQPVAQNQNGGNSRIVSQESEFSMRLKKCLRCSKQVDGAGYFCQACKNFC